MLGPSGDHRLHEQMFDTCVLGIDPGVARLGLAVVARRDRKPVIVWTGTVQTSRATPESERLHTISLAVRAALARASARVGGARAGGLEREQGERDGGGQGDGRRHGRRRRGRRAGRGVRFARGEERDHGIGRRRQGPDPRRARSRARARGRAHPSPTRPTRSPSRSPIWSAPGSRRPRSRAEAAR